MPLYMDFHKIAGLTLDDVRKAHLADLAVQEKYGVKYHQFWLNQDAGTIFCLTEGPDMETCAMVHRLAHGNVACAMTEVEPGYYKMLMGEGLSVDHGIVLNVNGSMDLGYRTIVNTQLLISPGPAYDQQKLTVPAYAREVVLEEILKFNGRKLKCATDDSVTAVFNDAEDAVMCARSIWKTLVESWGEMNFRIGLCAGQPVTENGEFFTKALKLAHQISLAAGDKQIYVSSLVKELCDNNRLTDEDRVIRSLSPSEENFTSSLIEVIDNNLSNESFSVEHLCMEMGISHPQLYRKIVLLTGKSPNDFLREQRMLKALSLLRKKAGNISEISLEVGYKNPSYFARCFAAQFGCSPSRFLAVQTNSSP